MYETCTAFSKPIFLFCYFAIIIMCIVCVSVGVHVPLSTGGAGPLLQLGMESGFRLLQKCFSLLGHLTSP